MVVDDGYLHVPVLEVAVVVAEEHDLVLVHESVV